MSLTFETISKNISESPLLNMKREESQFNSLNSNKHKQITINLNSIPEETESPLPNIFSQSESETKKEVPISENINHFETGYASNSNNHMHNAAYLQKEILEFLLGKESSGIKIEDFIKHRFGMSSKKSKFLNEQNFYLGDLVVVFPNPDKFHSNHRSIDFGKALKAFNKSFETDFSFFNNTLNEAFFKAFFQAFEALQSNHSAAVINIQEPQKNDLSHKKSKKMKESDNEHFFSNLIQNFPLKSDALSSTSKKNTLLSLDPNSPTFSKELRSRKGFYSQSKSIRSTTLTANDEILEINNAKIKVPLSPLSPKKSALIKPHQPRTTKTRSLKKEFKKEIVKEIKKGTLSMIEKANVHGGFLVQEKSKKWNQAKSQISDFFSLMRNAILYKLSQEAGFKTRSFLDTRGENIFTVLYSCDDNLRVTAELDSFNKQVNIARTDLLSLEPVDRKLRPIRLNILLQVIDIKNITATSMSSCTNYFSFVKPLIIKLLNEINYKRICRDLQINGLDENVEIIDDEIIPDNLWKAYYEYLVFIKDGVLELRNKFKYTDVSANEASKAIREAQKNSYKRKSSSVKKVPNFKIIKKNRRKILAKAYENLFLSALDIINSQYKKKKPLQTIWDHSKMPYQEAFFDYFQTSNRMSFRVKNKLSSIWKSYQITEKGDKSLFTRMERLKLAYNTLQKFVNIAYMIDNNYISEVFVLNDMLALKGTPIKALLGLQISFQTLKTKALTIKKLAIDRETENPITEENEQKTLKTEEEEDNTNNTLKQTYDNLLIEWTFRVTDPIYVPVEKIRNYYGEKVALYFQFLSHYTKYLSFMAGLGLTKTIVYYLVNNNDLRFIIDIFICISIGIWSNAFVLRWGRKELQFAIKYGQLDFEQDEQERSLFHGTYKRSLVTDQMNVLSYSTKKKYSKIALAFLVSMILITINTVFVVLFFELVILLNSKAIFSELGFLRLDIAVPAFLNNILSQFFFEIFTDFALKYTKFENHRTLSLFERNYITKKFLFSLVIIITPLAFISFLNEFEVFGLSCVGDCGLELQIYLRTYYVFSLFTNLWEIVKPKLLLAYNNFKDKKTAQARNDDQEDWKRELSQDDNYLLSKQDAKDFILRDKFMSSADKFLEHEFKKSNYSDSQDIYGTVEDYMEITLNYALLALFGIGDPLVFCVAFVSMILEMQTDKIKLIKYTKRPIPLGERTIGIWLDLMQFVCNVSVLTNSGIIAFTKYDFSASDGVLLFVILILVSYSLNWMLNSIFAELPGNMSRIMKRHDLMRDKIIKGIGHASTKPLAVIQKFPIFKIFNTKIIIEGEDLFEDVNDFDYTQNDKGFGEINHNQALKTYRETFQKTYFKEFRWNPHMTSKTPGIILQERAHINKRRTPEFRKGLLNIRNTLGVICFKGRSKFDKKNFKFKKNKIANNKNDKLDNLALEPCQFLSASHKTKQNKRDELSKYLIKEENILKEQTLLMDLGLNSNEYLQPNDFEHCLSEFSKGLFNAKRNQLPLTPWLKSHEIILLEKSLCNIFNSYTKTIELQNRIYKEDKKEMWIGYNIDDINYKNKFLAVGVKEIDENYWISKEYRQIKQFYKLLMSVSPEEISPGFFSMRKHEFYEIKSFDFLENDENSKHFLIEIFESGALNKDSSNITKELTLGRIIEQRSQLNAFYSDSEILYFLYSFLRTIQVFSKHFTSLYIELNLENIVIKRNLNSLNYFYSGPNFNSLNEKNSSKFEKIAETLIMMISLNKLAIDWNDLNAITIILETFSEEYPRSILFLNKLFEQTLEKNDCFLLEETIEKLEKETKTMPNDYIFYKKFKKYTRNQYPPEAIDFLRIYNILGNERKASEIIKSIPQSKKTEKILFYEAFSLLKSENCQLETLESNLMDYLENLKERYGECDHKEIKIYYFLAYKALELKKFDRSLSNINLLWRTLQVNFLKENHCAFIKFYELQGKTLIDANKPFEALKSFEKLLSFADNDIRLKIKTLIFISRIEIQIGKPLQALNRLNECRESLEKGYDPMILLIYGFMALIYGQLGKIIKRALFIRKFYKWMLKYGVSKEKEVILAVIEVFWVFPECFNSFPQDICQILLSELLEMLEKMKGSVFLEGVIRLILARIYYFENYHKCNEMLDIAERNFKENLPADIELQKKLCYNKFLYFILELRLRLLLKDKSITKEVFKELLKQMDQLEITLDFHDFNWRTLALYNKAFFLYMRQELTQANSILISLIEEKNKYSLTLAAKNIVFDLLGFISSLLGEEESQNYWVEMLEANSNDEELQLLGYLRLSISLLILQRYEKAIGFLEYLKIFYEKEKENKQGYEIIMLFDIMLFLAFCYFKKGNYLTAKGFLEKGFEMCRKYSKEKNCNFLNEKPQVLKLFGKFFKDKLRRSFILNNLAKINGFLDENDKAYFILNKCFRTLKKDFTHIKYSLKKTQKNVLNLTKNLNKLSNNMNRNKNINVYSDTGDFSKISSFSKEEEILNICLQSANPSNLIAIFLNIVKIQMQTYKYDNALELLNKIESVLQKMENFEGLSLLKTKIRVYNSYDLCLAAFFCKVLLIKSLFALGYYNSCMVKLEELKEKVKKQDKNNNDNKICLYWYNYISGWLHCTILRDFMIGFDNYSFCFAETPRIFGTTDASLLALIEDYTKIIHKKIKYSKNKEESKQFSLLFFQMKDHLNALNEKYRDCHKYMCLISKSFGNIELYQKNYYQAQEKFNLALKFAENTIHNKILVGDILLDLGKSFYKQMKLLEAEKMGIQALEHFKKFTNLKTSGWELSKTYYFLGKVSMGFSKMVEENLEILNGLNEEEFGKWEKHYVEIKLWEENQEILRIFEEYRENNLTLFLKRKLKNTYNEFVINEFIFKQAYRSSRRHYLALEHFELALMILKGEMNPDYKVHKRIEEKLIFLKYGK